MTTAQRRLALAMALTLALVPLTAMGAAQPQQTAPTPPEPAPNISPAEIQRMFDAYALMQAQQRLNLSDEQFPQFLSRYKALQDLRHRFQAERFRAYQELMRLSERDGTDDELRERLKTIQEAEVRNSADLKRAHDAVEQILDVRQQAKFRVFEELMERRKLELVSRARLNNRPRNRP